MVNSDRSPFEVAAEAALALTDSFDGSSPAIAVVLGPGWASAAERLGTVGVQIPMVDLPGFPEPRVEGHSGMISLLEVHGRQVVVLAGRSHLYEGHSAHVVVHAVRTAVLAGCETVVLTNAAGSLHPEWNPGTPVLISDQLNLTGTTPMIGDDPPERFNGRFCDLTDAYSPELRAVARAADGSLAEGVYAGMFGGAYETPSEIRMLSTMGADLVGMSTVLECIAARHLGAEVLGISLVTNLAAGLAPDGLHHGEVLEAAAAAADRVVTLLDGIIEKL
ncbi:MAG: purine-nucleoside phosphorylase [Acidimicrobiales bacterium]